MAGQAADGRRHHAWSRRPAHERTTAWDKSLDPARRPEDDQHMEIRIQCLCIDTADPARIASFWQAVLGWRRTFEDEDQVCLEPPEGSPEDGVSPDLIFLKVPEGKTAKNRLHLDLRPAILWLPPATPDRRRAPWPCARLPITTAAA